jgi:hypothetical protein
MHHFYVVTSAVVARAWGDVRPLQCDGVCGAVRYPAARRFGDVRDLASSKSGHGGGRVEALAHVRVIVLLASPKRLEVRNSSE